MTRAKILFPAIFIAIFMMFGNVSASDSEDAGLVKQPQCVEPTDYMRRYHMDVLMHQRDKTVINGIRTKKHSLIGCINCHTAQDEQGQHIPINAEGQFCESCHTYAAVQVDCFQCHRTTPDTRVSNAE